MTSPKQIVNKYQHHPRKRLGQSFLQDLNIARKMVTLAELQPEDTVVEIGAGLGAMTALIAAKVKQVMAVEVDPQLVDVLRDELSSVENVKIIHADVLAFDLSQQTKDLSVNKLKVIGNIPYNISSPILFYLLSFRRIISSAIIMLQKEVAERISAGPGTKSYGIPSILIAVYAKTVYAFTVPASCFYPVPKVTSAVIKIDFRMEPLALIENEALFKELVRLAFSNRRKTLMNNLKHCSWLVCSEELFNRLFEAEGLDLRIRGETLTPEQFISLSNHLSRLINFKENLE
jgi:16S rRNA (adenine1518-N6/adenine1519-N6)-dimethyltransferase